MTNESKNNQSPTCACGRVDLYEEWLKQNELKEKAEISDSATANQCVDIKGSDDDSDKQNQ